GHDRALVTAAALTYDDLTTSLPRADELREILRWILQIAEQHEGRVACPEGQSREAVAVEAEVARVEDCLHTRIISGEATYLRARAVGGEIVDEDDLVVILWQFLDEHRCDAVHHFLYAALFVEARDDDADRRF